MWSITWKRFRRSRLAIVALAYVALVALIAVAAPLIANSSRWSPRRGTPAMGTPPEGAVMIGDHAMDIKGAKAAGVKSVSVAWDKNVSEAQKLSDHHFTTVSDLHDWAKTILI